MDWFTVIQYSLMITIGLAVISCLIYKYFRDYGGKDISEAAELVGKYTTTYDYLENHKSYQKDVNVLVFDAGGKTRKFIVSSLAYDSVKKGAKGILTYHGERMINFHIKRHNKVKSKKYRKSTK